MKIISKYKDYYDYLAYSKYGVDDKIVLDRISGFVPDLSPPELYEHKVFKIAICGELHIVVMGKNGNFYWGKEIEALGEWVDTWVGMRFKFKNTNGTSSIQSLSPEKIDINDEANCPIVLVSGIWNKGGSNFPRLSDFKIARYISSDDMYMKIYNWILERNNPIIKDSRNDIQKLESAGFDKKKSFRHRK